MKLYEFGPEYAKLLDEAMDPETGELNPEYDALFDSLSGNFKDKLIGCAKVLAQMDADIAARKAEKERHERRMRVQQAARDRLEALVKKAMLDTDQKNVKTPLFEFRLGEPSKVCEAVPGLEIPEEYLKAPKPRELDKNKAKAALKAGKKLGFARIVDGKRTLKIV